MLLLVVRFDAGAFSIFYLGRKLEVSTCKALCEGMGRCHVVINRAPVASCQYIKRFAHHPQFFYTIRCICFCDTNCFCRRCHPRSSSKTLSTMTLSNNNTIKSGQPQRVEAKKGDIQRGSSRKPVISTSESAVVQTDATKRTCEQSLELKTKLVPSSYTVKTAPTQPKPVKCESTIQGGPCPNNAE